MINSKFDAILFGNGMTLNLLEQLKPFVKNEKLYLFNIDEFLKRFISNSLSPREEEKIFRLFYSKKNVDNIKSFEKLKYELGRYYSNNNANIEMIIGRDMFTDSNYDIGIIESLFPALYNIWFDLLYNYIIYVGLEKYINNFYSSVNSMLLNNNNVYTVNFDYMADNYLKLKHLHGKFITGISKYSDIYLCKKNATEFYFKCIWGWNGIGKLNFIEELSKVDNIKEYFDFSFFYEEPKVNNLLIYGLGFHRSGYITSEFLKKYSKHEKDNFIGTVIDEHILIRIKSLQNLKQLQKLVVTYYSESEKEYFKLLFEYYGINNVELVNASEFNFKVD